MSKTFTVFRVAKTFFSDLDTSDLKLELESSTLTYIDRKHALDIDIINAMLEHKVLLPAATVACKDYSEFLAITSQVTWLRSAQVTTLDGSDALVMTSNSIGDLFTDEDGLAYITTIDGFAALSKSADGKYLLASPADPK